VPLEIRNAECGLSLTREQKTDEESSLNALLAALNNLEALCDVVGQEYARAMERGPVEEAGEA